MLQKKSLLSKSGLHAIVWQEDDLFVAKCVEVELASQGKSEKEAINNLEEAMSLFFEDEKIKVPQLLNLRLISL
jgi:predicted RNase H-like HicB family nuclease